MNIQNIDTPSNQKPWYKEFWLWFILAPLITVVIVSAITVTLAVSGADKVVDGAYEKKGRMIHFSDSEGEQNKTPIDKKTLEDSHP